MLGLWLFFSDDFLLIVIYAWVKKNLFPPKSAEILSNLHWSWTYEICLFHFLYLHCIVLPVSRIIRNIYNILCNPSVFLSLHNISRNNSFLNASSNLSVLFSRNPPVTLPRLVKRRYSTFINNFYPSEPSIISIFFTSYHIAFFL